MGGENDDTIPAIDNKDQESEMVASLRDYAVNLGLIPYGAEYNVNPICYAASFDSWIIRATGEIGKCAVAPYDNINSVGHITEEGKLIVDKEKFEFWIRGQFSRNENELACPYFSRNTYDLKILLA